MNKFTSLWFAVALVTGSQTHAQILSVSLDDFSDDQLLIDFESYSNGVDPSGGGITFLNARVVSFADNFLNFSSPGGEILFAGPVIRLGLEVEFGAGPTMELFTGGLDGTSLGTVGTNTGQNYFEASESFDAVRLTGVAGSFPIDDVRFDVAVVPEPTTLASILALGVFGVAVTRRKRAAHSDPEK